MENRTWMVVYTSPWQLRGWGYGGPFVMCWTLCLQNGSGSASPAYKMVWQQTRPYKMVFLVSYLGSFLSTTILICSSKNGQAFAFMPQKKPCCRASTLSGTQLQGQFFHSHSHFVGFLPCHSFFFQFHPKLI